MNLQDKKRIAKAAVSLVLLTAAVGLLVLGGSVLSDDEQCGVERWAVKTGIDGDAEWVDLVDDWPISIEEMRSWPKPASLPMFSRIDPYEFYVFSIDCTLWKFKKETDLDYHLVLTDAAGRTMIAEIPHPGCVDNSSLFKDFIVNARAEFDAMYTPTTTFHTVNVPVTITGVAFFDFLHGQTGVAPNGIELHPVLDIVFTGR